MKKHGCIFFAAVLVLGLLMVTANAQAIETELPKIQLSGLIEVGAVWQNVEGGPLDEDESDLCLTTVEITAEAELNEWVNVAAVFLYEDASFAWSGEPGETTVEIDEAVVTIGNTEKYPLYATAGKMYVPFGALLTHFPDDPLLDAPVTLLLGETLEKAVLIGVKHEGFSVSAYCFNGDMDEYGEDNTIESYGFDANFSMQDESGLDILVGGSYISNIMEADVVADRVSEEADHLFGAGNWGVDDYTDGLAGYVHVGYQDFFVDGEYMTYLDEPEFEMSVAPFETSADAKPQVWNIEAGYNYDWGRNLEIVLKYAGSDEAEFLGIPQQRYGVCLNQDIFEDVVASVGYLWDNYTEDRDPDNREERDLVFAQIAIEF